MAGLDDLFEGAHAPRARFPAVLGLAAGGLLLATTGMLCTVLPGVALVLASWGVATADRQRVDSGYLAPDQAPRVRLGTWVAGGSVSAAILALLVQGTVLRQTPIYDVLLGGLTATVIEWRFREDAP